MKQILTGLMLLVLLSSKAQNNLPISNKPIYLGRWNGVETNFKSPYVVIINDSNIFLIRKQLVKSKVARIDTILFTYQAKAIEKGFAFTLKAPKALINKDTSLVANFLISNEVSKSGQKIPGQLKKPHPEAVFSVDFSDGSGKPSSLHLVKE